MEQQKLVILGDGGIGKTCLFIRFAQNTFPDVYIPTIYDDDVVEFVVDDKKVFLNLCDTGGGLYYDRMRPLLYPGTKVFLLCYDIACCVTFEKIQTYWFPEVQKHCPTVPLILCGNKLDLRDDQETLTNLEKQDQTPVTKEEGIKMAAEINAYSYVECSAKTKEGLREVFEEAVRAAFTYIPPKREKKCFIL